MSGRFTAILPGRKDMIVVCHEEPAECPDCLRRIAEFLAFEIDYNFEAAVRRTEASYRAELGEDRCTEEQARTLRLLTCQRCLPPDLRGSDLSHYTVADAEAQPVANLHKPVRHNRVANVFVTLMMCLAALALFTASAILSRGQ